MIALMISFGTVDSIRGRPEINYHKKNWLSCQPLRVDSAFKCKKRQFYLILFYIGVNKLAIS